MNKMLPGHAERDKRPVFRIFVSSPSDVVEERRTVDTVISELRELYGTWVHLDQVLWEKELLPANRGDFQQLICPVEETHLVIAILWSRIGYPLGGNKGEGIKPTFRPPTWSERNPTGTELEIVQALQNYAETSAVDAMHGFPDLLVYRRNGMPPKVSIEEAETASRQYKETCTFFDWLTRDARDGSFKAAFYSFQTLVEFEEQLKEHIARWIENRLGMAHEQSKRQLTWPHGSPFRALEPFDVEHHPVFFGRQKETFEILERFSALEDQGSSLLMLLGISGCGKSSLIRAGVIARLLGRRDEHWRYAVMTPGMEGNISEGLFNGLASETALPEMRQSARLQEAGAQAPIALAVKVEDFLVEHDLRLFVFVDQFEELFTGNCGDQNRSAFTSILLALARCKQVWVAAAIRSDFYHRLEELHEFFSAIGSEGFYHLQSPTPSAIDAIVRRPALAAGLRYETRKENHVSLDNVIIDDAKGFGDCLPLLEFTLHRLYEVGHEDGVLAYDEYEAIGRIGGAVDQHAQAAVNALDRNVQDALPRLLDTLVGLDSEGNPIRYYLKLDSFGTDTPEAKLIQHLVRERLLITGEDSEHSPTVALAHDLLLSHWTTVRLHVEQNRDAMQQRQWLHDAVTQWQTERQNPALLLNTNLLIDRAEVLWVYAGETFDKISQKYVEASVRRQGRKGLTAWIALLFLDSILLIWLFVFLGGLFSPSFVAFCHNDTFLKNFCYSYSPIDITITIAPIIYILLYCTVRKIWPVPSIKNLSRGLWSALIGLSLEALCLILHPLRDVSPSSFCVYDLPVLLVFGGDVLNSLLMRKRTAAWRRFRHRIKHLNSGKLFMQPVSRCVIFLAVFIACADSVYNEFTRTQSEKNLIAALDCEFYQPGVITASVENGADVNTKNKHGLTALHLAAFNNDNDTINRLIKAGGDVNGEDISGNTIVALAVQGSLAGKDGGVVRTLISAGGDVNHANRDGITPLFLAVQGENTETVKALLEAGADQDIRAPTGMFPAYVAAQLGHIEVLAELWRLDREQAQDRLFLVSEVPDDKSFDLLCCAAAWNRWQGKTDKALWLYGKALKTGGVGGTIHECLVLAEEANTYFAIDPIDPKGLSLLEEVMVRTSEKWIIRAAQGNLVWRYILAKQIDKAKAIAEQLRPELDETQPSAEYLNYAHTLLCAGDVDEACAIYSKFRGAYFPDGREWTTELISDLTQMEWLGFDLETIERAKAMVEVKTLDVSLLRDPAEFLGRKTAGTGNADERQQLAELCRAMTGTWRCEELYRNQVFICEWAIEAMGTACYRIYHADGDLFATSHSFWKVGIDESMIIWGERNNADGSITLATIQFRGSDKNELLLTLHGTTQPMTNFCQRLYRRIQ